MSAASRNQGIFKQTIRLFSTPRKVEGFAGGDDFDEADVWTCQPESKPDNPIRSSAPRSRSAWQKTAKESSCSAAGSIPVHVPGWPKVLQHDYKNSRSYYNERAEEADGEDDDEEIVPPHEVVMRRRAASLSVVEGAGRTLKGRDLSRVRNAIWAQTGFQD